MIMIMITWCTEAAMARRLYKRTWQCIFLFSLSFLLLSY